MQPSIKKINVPLGLVLESQQHQSGLEQFEHSPHAPFYGALEHKLHINNHVYDAFCKWGKLYRWGKRIEEYEDFSGELLGRKNIVLYYGFETHHELPKTYCP